MVYIIYCSVLVYPQHSVNVDNTVTQVVHAKIPVYVGFLQWIKGRVFHRLICIYKIKTHEIVCYMCST